MGWMYGWFFVSLISIVLVSWTTSSCAGAEIVKGGCEDKAFCRSTEVESSVYRLSRDALFLREKANGTHAIMAVMPPPETRKALLQQSLELINRAILLTRTDKTLFYIRALVNEDLSEYDSALADLNRVLSFPDAPRCSVLHLRGKLLQKKGDVPAAIETYKTILAEEVATDETFSNLANCYFRLAEYKSAATAVDNCFGMCQQH